MLKSMTGYGRQRQTVNGVDVVFEIKSVNHRYFEFSSRMPRAYSYLEDKIKSLVSQSISRGKVDVFVSLDIVDSEPANIKVNDALLQGYVIAMHKICDEYNLSRDDIKVADLTRLPDIFNVRKADDETERYVEAVQTVAVEALSTYNKMREAEGKKLLLDILERLDIIQDMVNEIERLSPLSVEDYSAKLREKIAEYISGVQIDEGRLLTEVAIFSERVSVTEEIVRLKSHIFQFRKLLNDEKPMGKKMDFLMQEMNREINTTGSKANNIDISKLVVEVKSEFEKIREQIQNIE